MTIWIPRIDKSAGPIYLSIADAIENAINSGKLQVGVRLPPQRELAYQLGVTLSTITRAYAEAERRKLVHGETGRGTYVSHRNTNSPSLMPQEEVTTSYDFARNSALPHLNPDLADTLKHLAEDSLVSELNKYAPSEGLIRHREAGAKFFKEYYDVDSHPDQTLITCGAQHGIMVTLQSLFNRGDAIAIDELTYPSMITTAITHGLNLIPIEMNKSSEGHVLAINADSLRDAAKKHNLKGIFLIPNAHNPTTHTATKTERRAIAEIAERFQLIIIEDDPYTPFIKKTAQSFSALLPEQTISIATPSKAMTPGLRTAFVHSPSQYVANIRQAISSTVWLVSPLTAEIVSRWLTDGTLAKTLDKKREETAKRYKIIARIFEGYTLQGGLDKLIVWLHLPNSINPMMLEASLARQNIEVLGSHHFHLPKSSPSPALRLSLGTIQSVERYETALINLKRGIESGADPMMG